MSVDFQRITRSSFPEYGVPHDQVVTTSGPAHLVRDSVKRRGANVFISDVNGPEGRFKLLRYTQIDNVNQNIKLVIMSTIVKKKKVTNNDSVS
jgi:hypothetical protein